MTTPPFANRIEQRSKLHGRERLDPYAWLANREDPKVREYLESENAFTHSAMAPSKELQEQLYEEMVARIREDDQSVPARDGPFVYYWRTERGKDYPIHCRRPVAAGAADDQAGDEHIYIDENALAGDAAYFDLADIDITPDHRIAGYSVDREGDERYQLRFIELQSGNELDDVIEDVGGSFAFAMDGKTLLYIRLDDAHRPYQVWRHTLGTPAAQDTMVFHEPDAAFYIGISRTRSQALMLIASNSETSSEVWTLPAHRPHDDPTIVASRRAKVEYSVEHHGDQLYITNNDDALDFKVSTAALQAPGSEHWRDFIPHQPGVMIEDVDAFERCLVVTQRRAGAPEFVVIEPETGKRHTIEFPEQVRTLMLGMNPEYSATGLRVLYSSLKTPATVFDYNLAARTLTTRKVEEVRDYAPSGYQTERIWAKSADGTEVPISLVRRAGAITPGPLYLTAYGAYGVCSDALFQSTQVSLLKRGVTLAIAHVRGGADLGRRWYDTGKLEHKTNTFDDFEACAGHLIDAGYTSADRLAIYGGSAGGLLIGAVLNRRPQLFHVAVADVPFVDVINTLLDENLPLTITEWDEWGNPADPKAYEWIAGYSPYDNVAAQSYPHTLVLAGWSDPRVGYWEPAKLVAKLRATGHGESELLLKTDLDSGHAGPSGRYAAFRDWAFTYAFVLRHLGLATRV